MSGLLVAKELDAFSQVLDADKVQRPLTAIVGGAKIKDKILVLENLIDKSDRIMCARGVGVHLVTSSGVGAPSDVDCSSAWNLECNLGCNLTCNLECHVKCHVKCNLKRHLNGNRKCNLLRC